MITSIELGDFLSHEKTTIEAIITNRIFLNIRNKINNENKNNIKLILLLAKKVPNKNNKITIIKLNLFFLLLKCKFKI